MHKYEIEELIGGRLRTSYKLEVTKRGMATVYERHINDLGHEWFEMITCLASATAAIRFVETIATTGSVELARKASGAWE